VSRHRVGRGGALETVIDGVTGMHVSEPSADAFAEAMNTGDNPIVRRTGDSRARRTVRRQRFLNEIRAEISSLARPDVGVRGVAGKAVQRSLQEPSEATARQRGVG
jgi:hypothetical protein